MQSLPKLDRSPTRLDPRAATMGYMEAFSVALADQPRANPHDAPAAPETFRERAQRTLGRQTGRRGRSATVTAPAPRRGPRGVGTACCATHRSDAVREPEPRATGLARVVATPMNALSIGRIRMPRTVLILLVSLAGLLAGCGSGPSNSNAGFVGGDGTITRLPIGRRPAAPSIEGTTLDGATWKSGTAAGKVIVYNVWGSWCAPCRSEAPALVAASRRTSDKAVFVGLNTRDLDPAPARAFVRSFGVRYVNLYDPDGALLLKFTGQLPASAIPSTLVVDTDGRVAARVIGETTEATLVGLVEDLIAGK